MKDPKSPATTMAQYDAMLPAWSKIQTVLDGTAAMRDAGDLYLPQHDKESDTAYRERLERCTLLNMTKLTLDSWVGRPFSEPVDLKDDVPIEIEALSKNIDTLGNNVEVFARNWFKEGVAKAYSHVLVDMPRTEERADGRPRSLEDDRLDGVRPYWVHITPEHLFFAEAAIISGREVLAEIRFYEDYSQRDGFAIVTDQQIKRLYLNDEGTVSVEIWRYTAKTKRSKKKVWNIADTWVMDIDVIPLVTFYSDRDSFMFGKSALEDLADINIAHWQSTSDQRAVLTVARFPILAVSGGTDDSNKLVIGPKKWLYCPDPKGKFYYVEHSGAAIQAGLDDLHELSRQMGEYGSEWMKKRPNRETATARVMDTIEATSALQDVTLRFQDALWNAIALTAKWLGLPAGGTVEIFSDFAAPPAGGETLRVLIEARKNKDLSREAFLNELVRAGILDATFDIAADGAKLENELLDMFPMPIEGDGDEEEEGDGEDE
ncbi:MAG: DUF4055 domain-containing protein [bacterium]|nr:DUF4055 domain-containing protein [bacterium]